MIISYKCSRCCNFETEFYYNIKKHYNRKFACLTNEKSILYSNDQLLCLTLSPYYNNVHKIDLSEIEHLKKSNIMDKHKNELFNELKQIEKNNIKVCKHCNKYFSLVSDLKRHFMIECFYNNLIKKNNEKNINLHKIDASMNGINNNLYNTNSNNNNNNNINIFIDPTKTTPIPFDEEWDISKINNRDKSSIMISQYMYTELLEEILKNDINLNVIIDKDKESGMVYKNNIDRYIQMKLKDIISNTMNKLNNHLNDINKNDTNSFREIVNFSHKMINKKYNDFKNNDNIQEGVKNCMSNIYENKKDDAINIAKKIIINMEGKPEYRI
jgi:hypothetical protein